MISESWIVVTSVLSLGSVIVIGVAATYLVSYGALLGCLLLSCLCVGLIAHGYVRALSLLLSPKRLRDSSIALLLARAEASVDESFLTASSNNLLAAELAPWDPARMTSGALVSRRDWYVFHSPRDGVVVDVNAAVLKRLLNQLGDRARPPVGRVTSAGSDAEIGFFASDQTQILLTAIGDRVRKGEPLVGLPLPHGRGRLDAHLAQAVRIDP